MLRLRLERDLCAERHTDSSVTSSTFIPERALAGGECDGGGVACAIQVDWAKVAKVTPSSLDSTVSAVSAFHPSVATSALAVLWGLSVTLTMVQMY